MELPVTVAVNCFVVFTGTLALDGLTLTATALCSACPESGFSINTVASTASKLDPAMVVNACRSSLFQPASGAPEMNQADPLSASIMPYCFSAVRITWLAAEKPDISKLALSRKRAPMGGYCAPVSDDA